MYEYVLNLDVPIPRTPIIVRTTTYSQKIYYWTRYDAGGLTSFCTTPPVVCLGIGNIILLLHWDSIELLILIV